MKCAPLTRSVMVFLLFLSFATGAWGSDRDATLDLLSGWGTETSTAERAPKPLSLTAENVTIITAAQIEALNAHTLADVLAVVPGLQIQSERPPGGVALIHVQGADFGHVLVLVDNVPLNNLTDNLAEFDLIPAQIIERVEIVKGAASASWGQALGGVINVITKGPNRERPLAGVVTSSIGERGTSDTQGAIAGTVGDFGYYLAGGYLGSAGILPNTGIDESNVYSKLTHTLPGEGQLTATVAYIHAARGDFAAPSFGLDENGSSKRLHASLTLQKPLTEQTDLEVAVRHTIYHVVVDLLTDPGNTIVQAIHSDEETTGGNVKILWRGEGNILATGVDYEHVGTTSNELIRRMDLLERRADRWGIYLNDTISLGPVALSPGIRFDRTGTGGDQLSAAFGITWQLTNTTLVRGYTGRGYSLPSLNLDHDAEKTWTSQVGIESTAIPYLWLKGTLFRNDIWNIVNYNLQDKRVSETRLVHGVEVEARTTPLFHTSLGAGYTFADARISPDSLGKTFPSQTLQLAVRYEDRLLKGVLTGRYIWWNADSLFQGSYSGILWDLHLTATAYRNERNSLEFFLSVHNLTNTGQYLIGLYPNPGRWIEGGARLRF